MHLLVKINHSKEYENVIKLNKKRNVRSMRLSVTAKRLLPINYDEYYNCEKEEFAKNILRKLIIAELPDFKSKSLRKTL